MHDTIASVVYASGSKRFLMRVMQQPAPGRPLELERREPRRPEQGEVLLRVSACGVCRTDLHIVDGELPALGHAVVPGHEIVGTVVETGSGTDEFRPGARV